jgi:hypothetical protein
MNSQLHTGKEYQVGFFLSCMQPESTKKTSLLSCYKKYKNSRNFLDEKAKYQPWIIKKKPKLDENRIKIGDFLNLHP